MSERVEKYTFIDEEGDQIKVNYISRSCMCSMNCNSDTIELFEYDDPIPYRLDIEGGDLKWFIKGLIDGDIKPKLTNK